MASFGTLAPGTQDPDDELLRSQLGPVYDWQDREAQQALAAQQEANRPSGLSTFWSALKHPSLYPMVSGMMAAQNAPMPAARVDLPDVGQPLVSPGPQISSGTRLGQALAGQLPQAAAGAIASGATAPGRAYAGEIPMWGPTGHSSEQMIQAGSDVAALAGGAGVAGTAERALGTAGPDLRIFGKKLLSDTGAPGAAVAVAEHAPQYTTGIESALSRIPSNELTGAQWANQLKRFGAKPEEMDWRQLGPTLADNANVKLPREAIEQHLASNPVQLNRIEKGSPPERFEDLTPEQQQAITEVSERLNRNYEYQQTPQEYYQSAKEGDSLPSYAFPSPKWNEYTIPGGENYRERLFQFPTGEPKFGVFHGDENLTTGQEFNSAEEARNYVLEARRAGDTTFPTGSSVRQTNDIPYFTSQQGSHWDEPNILFHRRSTDRNFETPLTPEQEAQNAARERAFSDAESVRQQQHNVSRQISGISQQHELARQGQILNDYRAGRITAGDVQRRMEEYWSPPEVKPLQDQLQALRAREDEIVRNAPDEAVPNSIKSLHDEENQSDWHQKGREKGYGPPPSLSQDELEELKDLSFRRKYPEGSGITPLSPEETTRYNELSAKNQNYLQRKDTPIPDAPFKGSGWERLALHDQLREAAEKGYPRISWTAGEDNPTNPMVMLRDEGSSLSEYSPERQAEIIRADKGIRDYYNRRRVDQANKVGKAHGVQVQRSSLPNDGSMSGSKAMDILGIHPMHREDFWEQLNNYRGDTPVPSGELEGQRMTREQFMDAARRKGIVTYHMDIPDSLRRELLTKPMSLFEDTGELGKSAAIARQNEQQAPPGTTYASWLDALEGRPNTTYASWFDALEGRPRR